MLSLELPNAGEPDVAGGPCHGPVGDLEGAANGKARAQRSNVLGIPCPRFRLPCDLHVHHLPAARCADVGVRDGLADEEVSRVARDERFTSDRHARLRPWHSRALSPGKPLAGLARRRGRAGQGAGRARHHPRGGGRSIARAARLELLDRARIDEGFARTGHTLVPLVWELGRVVGEPHGGWVHWGATTQNITQTGDLLVLRQAHRRVLPA